MERQDDNRSIQCGDCEKRKNFPKYSCRTCKFRYTSNYKKAKEFTYRYQKKQIKKQRMERSDSNLKELYTRIRDRYFDAGYLPDVKYVSLQWKDRKV